MKILKKIGMWVLPVIAFACAVAVGIIVYGSSSGAKANRAIIQGNKFLMDLDYEQAKASFKVALEVEPSNLVAMKGLMQSAYETQDYDIFLETLEDYIDIVKSDETKSVTEAADVVKMLENAENAFDNTGDYVDFLVKASEDIDPSVSEEMDEWIISQILKLVDELIDQGEYEKAAEALKTVVDNYGMNEYKPLMKDILCKYAEVLWKQRNYEKAMAYIKEALTYTDDISSVQPSAYIVVRDYAFDLKNRQKYAEANDIINWYADTFGMDDFDILLAEIEAMERADANLQAVIERLNTAFDQDDIKEIENIMNGDEFDECAKQMHNVLFCDSLRENNFTGHGTAVYNVNGTPYVYYGDFVNGIRHGKGLWYVSSDNNHLVKYSLNWENGVPNGEGTCEQYSTITSYSYGGVATGTNTMITKETMNLVNGVYHGMSTFHGDVKSDTPYSYDTQIMYTNGIAQKFEVGEYTSEILDYMPYPVPVVYVETVTMYIDWYGYYDSHVWRTWDSSVTRVSGLGGYNVNADIQNVDLEVE